MKRILLLVLAMMLTAPLLCWSADDSTVDKHIADLKSSDAPIRAKAAFELGCG